MTNTGSIDRAWTAAITQSWLSLSLPSGTLAAGAAATVTVSLNATANGLAVGPYSDTVTFTDTTTGNATTRPVSLTVTEPITVAPSDGFTASGPIGGPFSPLNDTYTLANSGQIAVSWTAGATQPWMTVTPNTGSLAPNASALVTVSFNETTDELAPGTYADTVTFADVTTGQAITRAVNLAVNSYAGVWYVNGKNVSGIHNGTSWATAFTTVQQAVDLALSESQVWVAQGTYSSSSSGPVVTINNEIGHIFIWGLYGHGNGVDSTELGGTSHHD